MILWAYSLFFLRGVLTALTIPGKQTWHLMGVVFLPPATGSCYLGVARALMPQGEKTMG